MKMTYEEYYKQFKFTVDYTPLMHIEAILPSGIVDAIKEGFNAAIDTGEYDFTFEEYCGMILLVGLKLSNDLKLIDN